MNLRSVISLLLLALVLAGAGALAAWGLQRVPGEAATYRVEAVGPEGVVLDATVHVPHGTVLGALQAAAAERGTSLELVEYAGMGTYVRGIGGLRAGGATGWIYEVHRDDAWINGDRSAEYFALQKGDAVRWSWTAG